MQIKTNKGETISVGFAFAPTTNGHMIVKMQDDGRRMGEVCEVFEDVTRFEYQDETKAGAPVTMYDGYTRIMRVSREGGMIMVTLAKP